MAPQVSDPAVAAEIDRTLSLLPLDIPGEDRDSA